jgi:hypothetical protein
MKEKYIIQGFIASILACCILSTNVYSQAFTDNTVDAAPSLPVKLLSFSAKKMNGNVEVNWVTANEKNNSHFNVERSTNGADFDKIGKVDGKGNSAITTRYDYTDFKSPNVNLFYRLEQVDVDGKTTLSQVVMIKSENGQVSSLSVYPNPAIHATVNVSFQNIPVGLYSISIKNINGSCIYQKTFDHRAPTEMTQLYLNSKPALGVYILTISSGTETIHQKLIIE